MLLAVTQRKEDRKCVCAWWGEGDGPGALWFFFSFLSFQSVSSSQK